MSHNVRSILVVATLSVSLALCIAVFWSSDDERPTVIFRLPTHYNGPFVVVVLENTRRPTLPTTDAYEFNVPETGILIAEDDGALTQWHKAFAARGSGPLISLSVSDEPESRADVFNSNGLQKHGSLRIHWYFFGSRRPEDQLKRGEIEDALREMNRDHATETVTGSQ